MPGRLGQRDWFPLLPQNIWDCIRHSDLVKKIVMKICNRWTLSKGSLKSLFNSQLGGGDWKLKNWEPITGPSKWPKFNPMCRFGDGKQTPGPAQKAANPLFKYQIKGIIRSGSGANKRRPQRLPWASLELGKSEMQGPGKASGSEDCAQLPLIFFPPRPTTLDAFVLRRTFFSLLFSVCTYPFFFPSLSCLFF